MFVHAHPDDEASKGAATMAKLADTGQRVSVVTLTDGSEGEILNPKMDQPGVAERLQEVRRDELARALEVIGVTDHVWFGYRDSGFVRDFDGDGSQLADDAFYNLDPEQTTRDLVAVVRKLRPHVMVTYPEDGGYPHPDHLRCHDVSMRAFETAGDPEAYPDAGLEEAEEARRRRQRNGQRDDGLEEHGRGEGHMDVEGTEPEPEGEAVQQPEGRGPCCGAQEEARIA